MKPLGDGPVRCLLVRPEFLENTFYNPREMFQILGGTSAAPPLGLLTVAAHLPRHWELTLVDGDLGPITDAHLDHAQVLMISGKGPQERPIHELITRAHARGLPVVVGGAGPTLQPETFSDADYVVVGEAENVLPELLADLARGVSKGVYHSNEPADLTSAPVPRYDLARLDEYLFVGMNFSRGCPFGCEFCAQIEIFGRKPRCKPTARILAEHQALYDLGFRGQVDFGYDNLIGDVAKTEETLAAMAVWNRAHGYPFSYTTEATMNLAKLPRILELMRDNDFRYLFMGIESGEVEVLKLTHKGQNTGMPVSEAVRVINGYGIVVNTGLILGFDGESETAAQKMLTMVQQTGVFPTLVLPLHALPGTKLAARMAKEGRLFDSTLRIRDENQDRTDTATTGLNFVTSRPRTDVMRDLAHVLENLYLPANHFERVGVTTRQLKTARKFFPPLKRLPQLARAFARIVRLVGLDREAGKHFWKAIARAAVRNPGALEMVLGSAVMNANYARQSKSYAQALRAQIVEVERIGEAAYNRGMGATAERPFGPTARAKKAKTSRA